MLIHQTPQVLCSEQKVRCMNNSSQPMSLIHIDSYLDSA